MSEWGKVPKEVFTDARLSRTDVRVLGILCAHANGKTGLCTRKQGAVADELGLSRETVNRALKKLASLGYVEPRARPGMKRSLDYRVLVSDGAAGQLGLFDAGAAPRQARPKAPKTVPAAAPRCDDPITSVVTSKITSVVTPSVTAKEQTLVNREPGGSAQPREAQGEADDLDPPFLLPADAAPRGGAIDDEPLATALREAAGRLVNEAQPAFINLAEPLGWLVAGCDLEADIVPTLRGIAARHTGPPVRSWRYFAAAVMEARDRRQSAETRSDKCQSRSGDGSCNIVPFSQRGSHVDDPPRPAKGRFTDAFARRRRQFAGAAAGDEDGPS